MANFRTHLAGAALASTLAAYTIHADGLVDLKAALICAACGTLGGILPDIDADQSRPTKLIFGALALAAAAATSFALYQRQPIVLTGLAAIVALFVVGVVLRALLNRFCVHRGLIHSLPVAVLSGAVTASLAAQLGVGPLRAWLFGAFVCAGFIVHLLLDELYSVDLVNTRLKRSFGTALKFGVRKTPLRAALVCLAVFALIKVGPPLKPLMTALDRF